MLTGVCDVWNKFCEELPCVDQEYLKRAFAGVWLARGEADTDTTNDAKAAKAIRRLHQMPWE